MSRPYRAFANTFEISTHPNTNYLQYNVISQPNLPEGGLAPRRAHEVIDRMQLQYAQHFTPRASFDGRKNLFSKTDLSVTTFAVQMSKIPGKGIFNVKLEKVLTIRPIDVQRLSEQAPGSEQAAVNLLQILIRQAPNRKHSYPPQAKAFFIQTTAKDLPCGFLQAVRGYFQSVRPAMGKLIVNVDVANAAVWQPGPLINVAMRILNVKDIRALENLPENGKEWKRLTNALRNVLITVETSPNGKPRPIRKLDTKASAFEFNREGFGMTTVEAYFRDVHNRRIRHRNLFTVRVGRNNVIPAEYCNIAPGQIWKKKLSPEDQAKFLGFTKQRPDVRLKEIKDAISGPGQQLDWENSDVMRESGLSVKTSPMTIEGQVWNPPTIVYGESKTLDITTRPGSWNVLRQKFFNPVLVRCWALVCFESEAYFPDQEMERLAMKMQENLSKLGTKFGAGRPYISRGNAFDVQQSLSIAADTSVRSAGGVLPRDRPSFILVILPSSAAELRKRVKLWGDIDRAIATQCVRVGKALRDMGDQYLNNVALKINAKIGGINSTIHSDVSRFLNDAMVVGADVGHPGPGIKTRPSITSLVASVNPTATWYTSFVNVQPPRQEIIVDLKDMMISAMKDYYSLRKEFPAKVVFYRDGVSEGEFQVVENAEIPAIEEAFQALRPKLEFKPQLIFMVVGKRHHIRFFPTSPRDADNSGNCIAGFAVDSQITHPVYQDFYLQSHAGLLGTSRPAHYTVLRNDTPLTVQNLQLLSYTLCHLYASSTRSVSIPAPIFYADRLCARGDFHIPEDFNLQLSEDGATASSDSAEFNLQLWKDAFKQSGLNKRMYYL